MGDVNPPSGKRESDFPLPRERTASNDNIDERLERAMLTLERTVEEVSEVVSKFRGTMDRLRLATNFLICAFILLGLCLIGAGVSWFLDL